MVVSDLLLSLSLSLSLSTFLPCSFPVFSLFSFFHLISFYFTLMISFLFAHFVQHQSGLDVTDIHYARRGSDLREEYLKMIAGRKTCLVLGEGEYTYSEDYFVMDVPFLMYGQGREKTNLVGFGLKIEGKKSSGTVVVEDLKIKMGPTYNEYFLGGAGLWTVGGMDLIARRCTVEMCKIRGVRADNAHVFCVDLEVVACAMSGILTINGGTVKLSGENTRIHGNAKAEGEWSSFDQYGLYASPGTKIQLVAPLTKERVSTNNGKGGNWGGSGTIEQVIEQVGSSSSGETKSSGSSTTATLVGKSSLPASR
jgi:hypothetical protein